MAESAQNGCPYVNLRRSLLLRQTWPMLLLIMAMLNCIYVRSELRCRDHNCKCTGCMLLKPCRLHSQPMTCQTSAHSRTMLSSFPAKDMPNISTLYNHVLFIPSQRHAKHISTLNNHAVFLFPRTRHSCSTKLAKTPQHIIYTDRPRQMRTNPRCKTEKRQKCP